MNDSASHKSIKILMLEDNTDDVTIIERALKKGKLSFVTLQVEKREEYRDAILSFKPDVVLSDHALPGFNSREALQICRTELGDTPFILVSGTASDEFAASCIREGADDYISKSDMTSLPASIRTAIKKRKLEKLRRNAIKDLRNELRKLELINKQLDNYAYTLSHTLLGPLTTVRGLLNLAEQTHDLASLRSLHTMMKDSVAKVDSVVVKMLDQARYAHTDPQPNKIEWVALIDEVLRNLAYLDPEDSVSKVMHLETAVEFFSDRERVASVLSHVIANTLAHRNRAKHHQSITSIEVFTSREAAVIEVKDNGPGIQAEYLSRVFEMFFKVDTSYSGPGLGLFLAKEVVTKLCGTIDLSSRPNIGTTVRIELPNSVL